MTTIQQEVLALELHPLESKVASHPEGRETPQPAVAAALHRRGLWQAIRCICTFHCRANNQIFDVLRNVVHRILVVARKAVHATA